MQCAFLTIVGLLAGIPACLADVTLTLPAVDPPPLSVSYIGAGNGETTYALFPGAPTGKWSGQEASFVGTATLIEGPSWVVIQDTALFTESCALSADKADCRAWAGPATLTGVFDVTAPVVVQGTVPVVTGTPAPGGAGQTITSTIPTQSASSGTRLAPAVVGLWAVAVVLSSAGSLFV